MQFHVARFSRCWKIKINRVASPLLLLAFIIIVFIFIFVINRHDKKLENWNTPICDCCSSLHESNPNQNQLSTCSNSETHHITHGASANVVSFTYFDGGKKNLLTLYDEGIVTNFAAMKKYYPGFVMRIYTDATLKRGKLCEMVCKNYQEIQWCDIRKTPRFGDLSKMYFMTWRFLPLGDPTVNIFLSRDLDSVIIEREVGAVKDWLEKTTKPVQIMHDHVLHESPIMGGMWGASNERLGMSLGKTLQSQIISASRVSNLIERWWKHEYGFDQKIIADIVWPLRRKNMIVAYESYHCKKLAKEMELEVRPYPVQRKNAETDFVGNPDNPEIG